MRNILDSIFKRGCGSRLKIKRTEVILSLLAAFRKNGKKEVSLSEFQVAIQSLQDRFSLHYSFSKSFLYSYQLFEDLQTLDYEGDILEFQYRHDGFLPKSFIELSSIGLSKSKKIWQNIPEEYKEYLEKAASEAIERYQQTWRLWSRVQQLEPQISYKS